MTRAKVVDLSMIFDSAISYQKLKLRFELFKNFDAETENNGQIFEL
jgi:hypothetical protein